MIPYRGFAICLPDSRGGRGQFKPAPLHRWHSIERAARGPQFKTTAADETLRDEEDNIIRDVQVSKLNLEQYAHNRLALTQTTLAECQRRPRTWRRRVSRAALSSIDRD